MTTTTTTTKVRDYLDKELFVNRDIVTFRSLSRALGIHVDDAKRALQQYYDAVRDTDAPAVPTYLVSGEVPPLTLTRRSGTYPSQSQSQSLLDMDVDIDVDADVEMDPEEVDVVHQSKVLLVDARALDETVAQFSRIYAVHIYSLSPSRFGDAGLVCTPSFKVREADAKGGPEYFSVVGKMTGVHVKLREGAQRSVASSSRTTLDATAKMAPKTKVVAQTKAEHLTTTKGKAPLLDTKKEQVSTPLQRTDTKERLKPSGKLDWSRAKTKTKEKEFVAEKSREEKKPKTEPDSPVSTIESTSKKKSLEPIKASTLKSGCGNAQKRGTNRKSLIDTDQESESSSAKAKFSTAGGSSVKRGVVYSDEDEDDGEVRMLGLRRPKRKSTATSDSEMSLRAMMDIDDEQVDHVSRARRVIALREESEESEEEPEKEATVPPVTTEDEESDYAVPAAPKKRKPRKAVPVGRNGLKKRRVVKSRMTTDAKGYMQTEDYSSYESVEEEEEEEVKPKEKGKGKGKETKKASVEAKPKVVVREEGAGKPKPKPAPKPKGGAAKRGGLLNFFGPGKK